MPAGFTMEDAFLGTFTRYFMTACAARGAIPTRNGHSQDRLRFADIKRERHRFSRPVTLRRKVQSRV
jgi:hypothetical protein